MRAYCIDGGARPEPTYHLHAHTREREGGRGGERVGGLTDHQAVHI